MAYQATIWPAETDNTYQPTHNIRGVLDYSMLPGPVFYVAGTDFQEWHVLRPGQIVNVAEQEE